MRQPQRQYQQGEEPRHEEEPRQQEKQKPQQEQERERKVDATLYHRTPENTISPATAVSSARAIAPGSPLRLSVHIGERAEVSHTDPNVPDIGKILQSLAKEEVYELRIVLSPKDFALTSDAVQTLRLPADADGTPPVFWELTAPELRAAAPAAASAAGLTVTDTSRGRGWVTQPVAELRFSVYYQNQILQSFRLRAVLGQGELLAGGHRVLIDCDFSQSRRFGALHKLGPRVAAFSLNRDDSATHTLTLVRDQYEPVSISWSEGQMANHTGSIRHALLEVTNTITFDFDSATLRLKPDATRSFEQSVNRLANAGALLYVQLFQGNEKARPMLADIRKTRGEVLKIARLDRDYAFPWPLLYDFERPYAAGDAATVLPVCRGKAADGSECRCHENEDPQGWCLRGFWGLRLVIEQLYGTLPPLDDEPGKIADAPCPRWLGVMPVVTDDFVQRWLSSLPARDYISQTQAPPRLLPWIRGLDVRPHLIVFIGHHMDRGAGGIPDPQLLTDHNLPVLRLDDFNKQAEIDCWKAPPRSLVFLLACGSGTERVDTGTSLAAAMVQLGAVGVLATECTVMTDLVSRMARDLTQRLSQRQQMGRAMRETIFDLAVEGCPLGLAFCYLGSADAVLPQLSSSPA